MILIIMIIIIITIIINIGNFFILINLLIR